MSDFVYKFDLSTYSSKHINIMVTIVIHNQLLKLRERSKVIQLSTSDIVLSSECQESM